jgi:hypothetical protein
MRFALIATSIAAAVAIPFGVSAAGPQMSGDQFLSAVRCTAYEQIVQPKADLGAERMRLNAEARRQPVETAQAARAEVLAVSRQAATIANSDEPGMMRACEGPALAGGQGASTV